ncbi:hypothetical protein TNCV_2965361 [Trichonephila clavipes]|nr:hypothetical protein TNCV_2965361 [Trichonephila clavipes]
MASQFGEICLRNSCLAFIQLNFSFPQPVRSLIDKLAAYYARVDSEPQVRKIMIRERNEAPTEGEALSPGPVGLCLNTSLAIGLDRLWQKQSRTQNISHTTPLPRP